MTQFLIKDTLIPPYMAFPRFLLDMEQLSETAKILYVLLLDRARLSQKNEGWVDERGRAGPSTGQVPVRHTEQVLCEVIEAAKRRLFLVSFVAYEVDSIIRALRGTIGRQVQIDVLLESSDKHGGRVTYDSVNTMKSILPSIDVYVWSSDRKSLPGQLSGAVHAKCAIADGELAFITSANLTSAAMERNMELGVLVKGGELPFELQRHLEALISTKIIEKVSEDNDQ